MGLEKYKWPNVPEVSLVANSLSFMTLWSIIQSDEAKVLLWKEGKHPVHSSESGWRFKLLNCVQQYSLILRPLQKRSSNEPSINCSLARKRDTLMMAPFYSANSFTIKLPTSITASLLGIFYVANENITVRISLTRKWFASLLRKSKELYNTVITRWSGERFSFRLNTLVFGISEVTHCLVEKYTQYIFRLALE